MNLRSMFDQRTYCTHACDSTDSTEEDERADRRRREKGIILYVSQL